MEAWDRRRLEFEREALPHAQSLLRTALRLTRSLYVAEDLVQETLLSAWRSFDHFASGTDCKAWLFRIMLNGSTRQRAQAARSSQMFTPLGEVERPEASEASLLSWEIEAMLKDLPEEQRTALLLASVEGFTCKEIAEITNVPLGTVMSRLGRARIAMRARLLPHEAWSSPQRAKTHGKTNGL